MKREAVAAAEVVAEEAGVEVDSVETGEEEWVAVEEVEEEEEEVVVVSVAVGVVVVLAGVVEEVEGISVGDDPAFVNFELCVLLFCMYSFIKSNIFVTI